MPTAEAKLARTETKLVRLRWYVVILLALVIFASVVGPFSLIYITNRVSENTVVRITCDNYRNNVHQLEALADLEHRLGVPIDFTIPKLPEICR